MRVSIAGELNTYDIALLSLRRAMHLGADDAEVFVARSRVVSASINNNRVSEAHVITETGVGIRVAVGKKVGFASTNVVEGSGIEKAIERALSIARSREENRDWPGFPYPKPYSVPRKIYSPDLAVISPDKVVSIAKRLLDSLASDKRITVSWGEVSVITNTTAIANSNGVANVEHGTLAVISAGIVAKAGGDVTPIVEDYEASRVVIPPVELFAERLRDTAIRSLKPVGIESGRMPVVMHPLALSSLLTYTLLDAIMGDSVVRGRSFLRGREGEQVFSSSITIVDDGLLEHGVYTGIFDGEGVPMQKTVVIENGVVRGFLFDTYWAAKYGCESTGNAGRPGYRGAPEVAPTNTVFKPGDASIDELISETRRGLLVYDLQGAHSSNPETGEFSAVATPAWYIDKGELRPVRGIMISGNIYRILRDVRLVGDKTVQKGHWVLPYVRLEEVNVISP